MTFDPGRAKLAFVRERRGNGAKADKPGKNQFICPFSRVEILGWSSDVRLARVEGASCLTSK
jgi:hypothetical protein